MFGEPVRKKFTAIDGNQYHAVIHNENHSRIFSDEIQLLVQIKKEETEQNKYPRFHTLFETKVYVGNNSGKFTDALKKAVEEFNNELQVYNDAVNDFDSVEVEANSETNKVELKEIASKKIANFLHDLDIRIAKLERQ